MSVAAADHDDRHACRPRDGRSFCSRRLFWLLLFVEKYCLCGPAILCRCKVAGCRCRRRLFVCHFILWRVPRGVDVARDKPGAVCRVTVDTVASSSTEPRTRYGKSAIASRRTSSRVRPSLITTSGWRALWRTSQTDPSTGWSNALNEPDYTSMREPMITVRSRGKPKCSTASAVIWDVAMNRYLRHRGISGAAPTTSSMLDRK